MDTKPNIFHIATSELSQDAIITWLLQWADKSFASVDNELHQIGVRLIRLLCDDPSIEPTHVEAGRQWEHIDIWAEIDDMYLIIEDKTFTSEHDNQLERYRRIAEKEYPGKKGFFAYIKTGNEPLFQLRKVSKLGYKTFERKDILNVLNNYNGDNAILKDYIQYIQSIESATNEWRTASISNWSSLAWQGFYKYLEKYFDNINWGYVSNQSGGFIGAWWHFIEGDDEAEMYLQFEQGKFCFKLNCEGLDDRRELREKYRTIFNDVKSERFQEINRPDRLAIGNYMTIATVDVETSFCDECGILDVDRLIDRLYDYEKLVNSTVEQVNAIS